MRSEAISTISRSSPQSSSKAAWSVMRPARRTGSTSAQWSPARQWPRPRSTRRATASPRPGSFAKDASTRSFLTFSCSTAGCQRASRATSTRRLRLAGPASRDCRQSCGDSAKSTSGSRWMRSSSNANGSIARWLPRFPTGRGRPKATWTATARTPIRSRSS